MSARRLRVVDVVRRGGGVVLQPRTVISDHPAELATIASNVGADAVLIWDVDLDLPDPDLLGRLLRGPCHVWHAGLALGQAGRPIEWNACHGRAMFSCDVDPDIESTSWKVTARALLVRNEVLDELDGFDPSFDTTSGAALDAGLRWIQHGALMRHVPGLLAADAQTRPDDAPTAADGLRIVRRRLGPIWTVWALLRGLRNGSIAVQLLPGLVKVLRESVPKAATTFGLSAPPEAVDPTASVTVLVPTVGRYPYLEALLAQLADQSRPPDEVLVVDQNPEHERRDLHTIAPDLELKVLHLLPPGQCTARNLGLQSATGSHILFLDDDDEVPTDLIEQHLAVLASPEISVSCGVTDDRESGPAPASERYRKASGVFPTNNTMIKRKVLEKTGLFDPTYDRGARADHDLGMRSYVAGHLHVHDPRPVVFHHHAPMGGLREHGARVRTRGNSRSTLTERHLRTPTDIYLGLRYFTPVRVDDDLALSVFATLSGEGSRPRRILRLVVQSLLLPDTWKRSKAARAAGVRLLRDRPDIPALASTST